MQKMKRNIIIGLTLFFLIPYMYLFSPAKLKNYIYRELCYHTVVNNIKRNSTSFNDFLEKLTNYVYINSGVDRSPIIDDNSWDMLRRGYGYCDQQVWLLNTLLAKLSIAGRWVSLRNEKDKQGHSVAEVYVDGKWRVIDPSINKVFYKGRELAVYEDILDLDIKDGEISAVMYKLFYKEKGARWSPLTEKQNKLGQILFFPVYVQYRIFGNRFTYFYQGLGGGAWKERDRFLCS